MSTHARSGLSPGSFYLLQGLWDLDVHQAGAPVPGGCPPSVTDCMKMWMF